jgi:hypothetical protein
MPGVSLVMSCEVSYPSRLCLFAEAGVGVLDFLPICYGLIWIKSSMKYFSDFCISYQRGNLSVDWVSGLKATDGVFKTGYSILKPTGART